MRIARVAVVGGLSVLLVLASAGAFAQQSDPSLLVHPGDTFRVDHDGTCSFTAAVGLDTVQGSCIAPTETPTPTPPPTLVPVTPAPTIVPTAVPTLAPVTPVAGLPCPTWVHDQYVTAGPDGKMYPTWHPPIDPTSGCLFGHEHGADPSTSKANSTPPPFGYAAAQMGMTEPHAGYKVFVMNPGDVVESNVANKVSDVAVRLVFHQGTSGVGRYSQQFHSGQYDYIGVDGTFSVNGMFDTGAAALDGSTCSSPRKGAKDFSATDCADTYEIWSGAHFELHSPGEFLGPFQSRLYVSSSVAVFDPITTQNPLDLSALIYTAAIKPVPGQKTPSTTNPLSSDSYFQGCRREFYSGPDYWHNAAGATTYWTDPMGNISPTGQDAVHMIRQDASATTANTVAQFKLRSDYCGSGIHSPN
jgi:hypothetical protein